MIRTHAISTMFRAALLAFMMFGIFGCGDDKREKIVVVTGTVKYKGQPVPDLMVHFVPQTGKNSYPSHAKTDENGKFELVNYGNVKGVPEGTHKVYVGAPPVPKDGDDDAGKKKVRAKVNIDMAELLKKYGKQDTTPLSFTIKGDQVIDLNLD